MAQVLTPILQPTTSMTMLHSTADAFQTSAPGQPHHLQSRTTQLPRGSMYNAKGGGTASYRGSVGPIAPYAFQSTPNLRQGNRPFPAMADTYGRQNMQAAMVTPVGAGHDSSSASTASSSSSFNPSLARQFGTKDDTAISDATRRFGVETNYRPMSTISLSSGLDLSPPLELQARPSPDRFRRNRRPATDPQRSKQHYQQQQQQQRQSVGLNMPTISGLVPFNNSQPSTVVLPVPPAPLRFRSISADDSQFQRQTTPMQANMNRRRSLGSIETSAFPPVSLLSTSSSKENLATPLSSPRSENAEATATATASFTFSGSNRERSGSGDSASSTRSQSRPSSARRDSPNSSTTSGRSSAMTRQEPKNFTVPPRASSDAAKRLNAPSPLSRPVDDVEGANEASGGSPVRNQTPSPQHPSVAAQHLAAVSDRDANRNVKSRLRRAFSFSSSAELRKASAVNNFSAERSKLVGQRGGVAADNNSNNERDEAEQEIIAAKQEAAGIGAGIYSGQGGVFAGSTDNVSVSSTASSASIMLRKMGQGMKKSGRSLKGLFRAKSRRGLQSAEAEAPQPSVGQVSMVTVEAERQKGNASAGAHGEDGEFNRARLEGGSLDAADPSTSTEVGGTTGATESNRDAAARRSIIGSDRERAEVLAAVKKGILKRSGTSSTNSSPVVRPVDTIPSDPTIPPIPTEAGLSRSSSASTLNDDSNNVRPVLISAGGQDYFVTAPRLPSASTRSLPNTPGGTTGARNISFSPRIQFHDAWSSSEYDRRGEIATCNRLTPMLAQQIKEELNTFKMEMEVHELSKPHTHFF